MTTVTAVPVPRQPLLNGGYIVLNAWTYQGSLWSVMQWQDALGAWHDVEGWRGHVQGVKRWWVAPGDLGKGPFRWVVYAQEGDAPLAVSDPFHLPAAAGERVTVTLSPGQ